MAEANKYSVILPTYNERKVGVMDVVGASLT
jgi:hypothetical protein